MQKIELAELVEVDELWITERGQNGFVFFGYKNTMLVYIKFYFANILKEKLLESFSNSIDNESNTFDWNCVTYGHTKM